MGEPSRRGERLVRRGERLVRRIVVVAEEEEAWLKIVASQFFYLFISKSDTSLPLLRFIIDDDSLEGLSLIMLRYWLLKSVRGSSC
jgi:hypothetical protein